MKLVLNRVRVRNPLIIKLLLSVVILMILLVLTGIIGYYYLTRPEFMRKQLLAILKNQVNGQVKIDSTQFNLSEGFTVYGLEIIYKNEALIEREIEVLNIPELNIQIDYKKVINSLLRFEFKPAFALIQIEKPSFVVRFDKNGNWLDREAFIFPEMKSDSDSTTEIPQIIVNDAKISIEFPMIFNEGKENVVKNISFRVLQKTGDPKILNVSGYAEAEDIGEIEIEAIVNQETKDVDLQIFNHNVLLTPQRIKNFIPEIQSVYEDFIASRQGEDSGVNAEIVGRVLYTPDSAVLLDLDVKLINGFAKYFQFPVPIEIIAGHIKLKNHEKTNLPDFGEYVKDDKQPGEINTMGNLSADLNIQGVYNGSQVKLKAIISDIGTEIENLNIVINAKSVLIDNQFKKYLQESDEAPEAIKTFIKEFNTNGIASVMFVAGKKDIQVTIDIEEVNTTFSIFPMPLSKLHGRFEGSANIWDVVNLQGETTKNGQNLTVNVSIRENEYGKTVITSRLKSESISLEKDLIELLPKSVQKILSEHNISGTAAIESAEIVYVSGSPEIDYKFNLTPVNVRYNWQNFPYTVSFNSGNIEIDKEMVRFENIEGGNEDSTVSLNGWIAINSTDNSTYDLRLQLNKLKIDDQLQSAIFTPLPKGHYEPDKTVFQTIWNMFQPGGEVNLELRISPDEARKIFAIVHILEASITYDKFPLPIRATSGEIQFSNFANAYYVKLSNINGKYEKSTLSLEGTLQGDPSLLFLHFDAKNCLIDGKLKEAYEHLETNINKTRSSKLELWKMLKPSGLLDLSFDIYNSSNDNLNVSMVIDFSKGSAEFIYFPYPLSDVSGRVLLDSNGVRLENVVGYHQKTKIEIKEGKIFRDGYEVTQIVTNSIIDKKFFEAIPKEWQALISTLQIRGRFNAVIEARISDFDKEKPTIIYRLRFELPYNSINVGLEIEDLTGIISIDGMVKNGEVYTVASIEYSTARWNNYKVTAGSMDLIYGDNKIEINNFNSRIYNGVIKGRIKLNIGENAPFEGYFKYSGIQLSDLLANTAPGSTEVRGNVTGDLAVYGTTKEKDSLEGIAKFSVSNAWVMDVPIVLKLFDFVNYFNPTPIDEIYGEARIFTNKIILDRLDLLSDAVAMYGKGQIVDSNKISFKFGIDISPRALFYPQPVRWLVKGIEKNILPVYIVGTISKPELYFVFPPKTGEAEKSVKKGFIPNVRPGDWKMN